MQAQQETSFAEEFQPQPGSNVQRIIALSDCVMAVAFTPSHIHEHQAP